MKSQIQEAQSTPRRINAPRTIPRQMINKLQKKKKKKHIKHKEKVLKEARVKTHLTYRATKKRITLDFSLETTSTKRVE